MDTNFNFGITVRAGQDLSVAGAQYKAIKIDGTIAGTPQLARGGLLQTKPQSGEHGTGVILGIAKGVAGAAINSGAAITVAASGFLTALTPTVIASGTVGVTPIGYALVQAASGDIFKCAVNFINGGLAVGSGT